MAVVTMCTTCFSARHLGMSPTVSLYGLHLVLGNIS